MKRPKNNFVNLLILFLLLYLAFPSGVTSQTLAPPPPNSGPNSGSGFDDDVQDEIVPIDGFVLFGLLAASIIGIRNKKNK